MKTETWNIYKHPRGRPSKAVVVGTFDVELDDDGDVVNSNDLWRAVEACADKHFNRVKYQGGRIALHLGGTDSYDGVKDIHEIYAAPSPRKIKTKQRIQAPKPRAHPTRY